MVLDAAFSSECESQTLYLNENDEWSSLIQRKNGGWGLARSQNFESKMFVQKIWLFDFIKCDIEGMDGEFLKLLIDSEKPRYVSIELNNLVESRR